MELNIFKETSHMLEACNKALNALEESKIFNEDVDVFAPFACMMFDIYTSRNKEFTSPELSKIVSEMIAEVNEILGTYPNETENKDE